MTTIYLDLDFKCHTVDDGTMIAVESDFFDGKCPTFIEGYRFVPEGKNWIRSDGVVFYGEMIVPWRPYSELEAAQQEYERLKDKARIAELEEALELLLSEVTE